MRKKLESLTLEEMKRKEIRKEKNKCLFEVVKNIPGAILESALYLSVVGGGATALLGGLGAYFFGKPELAKMLAATGGLSCLAGLVLVNTGRIIDSVGVPGEEEYLDWPIEKICEAVKDYKKIKQSQKDYLNSHVT